MELTKQDTKMTKGLAIILMVLLHLFCRLGNLPYECLKIGGVPLSYYIGLFGDQCTAIFCFCSGYALYLINEKFSSAKEYYKNRSKPLLSFLINYWIVVVIFSIVGLLFDKSGKVPGTWADFFKNFFFLENNYNGAWWFVFTYVLLVVTSRPIYLFVKKLNPVIVVLVASIIYLPSYIQRIDVVITTDYNAINWTLDKLSRYGTSVFPFIIAMIFYKYKLFAKLRKFKNKHFSNSVFALLSVAIVFVMIVGHTFVPSLIVAPITGLVTFVLFNLVEKGTVFNKLFDFFGEHSTNIWLVHMFFYLSIFKDLVFIAKYPLFIFLFMMVLSLTSSYIINVIYKLVLKIVFKKSKKTIRS